MKSKIVNFGISTDNLKTLDRMENCARCGESHLKLPMFRFGRPVVAGTTTFTHWCLCPKTKEPVVLKVDKELTKEMLHV